MTYTPNTEEVRKGYAYDGWLNKPVQVRLKGFDRWLEAHDREVAAKALEEAADSIEGWAEKTTHTRVTEHVLVEAGATGYLREMAQQLKEQR